LTIWCQRTEKPQIEVLVKEGRVEDQLGDETARKEAFRKKYKLARDPGTEAMKRFRDTVRKMNGES
jgi:hypothetical protein